MKCNYCGEEDDFDEMGMEIHLASYCMADQSPLLNSVAYRNAEKEEAETKCYCGHTKSMHDSDGDERQEKFWCNGDDCDCGRFIPFAHDN